MSPNGPSLTGLRRVLAEDRNYARVRAEAARSLTDVGIQRVRELGWRGVEATRGVHMPERHPWNRACLANIGLTSWPKVPPAGRVSKWR